MDEQPLPPVGANQPEGATQPDAAPRVIYPPPPNVHWAVLFGAQFVIGLLAVFLAPKGYRNLVSNLAMDAWAIYFCMWLRKLDPESMAIFWCAANVVLQLALNATSGPEPMDPGMGIIALILVLLYIVTWIAMIYVIRGELHTHYNKREPVGLYLGPFMTFFFSFLYFQYHLYNIAQRRERYGDRPFYYQGGPPLP